MFFDKKNQQEEFGLLNKISLWWQHIQPLLFPIIEKELDPLTEQQRNLISIIDLVRIEQFVQQIAWNRGRPVADRVSIARAFVAKHVCGLATTRDLIEHLRASSNLRRICGWELACHVPSESTFSRAFNEFARTDLAARAHQALIQDYRSDEPVGHVSRDATDIPAREEAVAKPPKPAPEKKKMGRPRKGEERPAKEPTRLERQVGMKLPQMVSELPTDCDWGTKKKAGKTYRWKGYKLHVDWADGEIPLSQILTSASVNDSQVAIPLAAMTAARVDNYYDLMDSAYDAKVIREYSVSLGHVPIIDHNARRGEGQEMGPATKQRYAERTTAERGFSLLKENFGGRNIRVRGHLKVFTHLGFCLLALAADRLLNLLL